MIVKHSEIWVCVDCLMMIANGDDSGASDDWDAQALETFGAECARDGLQIVATSSEETDREFSAMPCGACNSHLAGSRHSVTLLENVETGLTDDETREVIAGYVACAEWLTPDDDGESVDHCEVSDVARSELADDCVRFLASVRLCTLRQYAVTGASWSQFGHDFWLTRNHHGAGFWDRGLGEVGSRLTELSHAEGGRDTFFNEDTSEIEVL